MKIAEQLDYVSALSDNIKNSLIDYTGSDYERLNKRLRMGLDLTEEQAHILRNIDNAFKGVPLLKKAITVYRGLSEDLIPKILTFLSTSYDKERASKFSSLKCCLLIINVPSGTKILPLEKISENPQEKEILLPRKGEFNITNITYENERKTYHISFIPETAVAIDSKDSKQEIKDAIKKIEKTISIEEWADRLMSVITPDDIELFGNPREIVEAVKNSFKEDVPQKAIEIVITRLKNMV